MMMLVVKMGSSIQRLATMIKGRKIILLVPLPPLQNNDVTSTSDDDDNHRTSPCRSEAAITNTHIEEARKILKEGTNSKREIRLRRMKLARKYYPD